MDARAPLPILIEFSEGIREQSAFSARMVVFRYQRIKILTMLICILHVNIFSG